MEANKQQAKLPELRLADIVKELDPHYQIVLLKTAILSLIGVIAVLVELAKQQGAMDDELFTNLSKIMEKLALDLGFDPEAAEELLAIQQAQQANRETRDRDEQISL